MCTRAASATLAALVLGSPVLADTSGLPEALTSGEAGLDFRYRYEFVDQDGFAEDAHASTLRLRLNYETGSWRDWTGFVEFDHLFEVLLDDFNNGAGTSSPARDVYPVVADPDGPDLNQLYLQLEPGDEARLRFGRQRILLDDQRYVGGVGWRQNEQTYDALSLKYGGFERTDVFFAYVANVNRILGDESPAGDHEQDTFLLNAHTRLSANWGLVGYAYVIDNEDAPAFSTRTVGIRATGGLAAGDGRIELLAEIATQSDHANNPASYDTAYFRLQGDWQPSESVSVGAGVESLGSDAGQGFRTPLATLHAFNGWADQFLATPGSGLEDFYLTLGIGRGPWNFRIVAHDFSAETGGTDFGREFDASASRKLGDRYGLLLKIAAFDADDPAFADVTKAWIMLTAGF